MDKEQKNNVVDLLPRLQKGGEPISFDLVTAEQANSEMIELVINDYGTIRVVQITKTPNQVPWIFQIRSLEEMIDEVLNNPET